MKKIIFLRGHQGSGKSTFAQKLIDEHKAKYPNLQVHWAESDQILIEQQGGYHWTPDNLRKAMDEMFKRFKNFVKSTMNESCDVLIINSNTNQTLKKIQPYIDCVKKQKYEIEVYVMTNFFENIHNVGEFDVASVYVNIRNNPIEGEVYLPCTTEPSAKLKEYIDIFENAAAPIYDPEKNSYLTAPYLLANKKNIIVNRSRKYPELSTYKYTQDVFWNKRFDRAMIELRGLVLDGDFNMVVRPFNKVFNLSERMEKDSTFPYKISPETEICAMKKINGFLGCATYVSSEKFDGKSFNNRVLYSTTGFLDSSFAQLAESRLSGLEPLFKALPNHTFMFEVVDPSDPHIIEEVPGVYLLACRNVENGLLLNHDELKEIAQEFLNLIDDFFILGVERAKWGEIEKKIPFLRHEGFVIYDKDMKDILFKVKTPYYLITKFFGRFNGSVGFLNKLKNATLDSGFMSQNNIDEEYFPLITFLKDNVDQMLLRREHERISLIRDFLNDKVLLLA
ncbi:RNA ligase [Campylobacter sp. MOP7]|uniref:RNA ligase n=1 Tax=Campylobacter canis TaxID=3378588 RepID=UPI00387E732F